ncbi:MAG: hypothetical protein AAGD38_14310 [Acidobacteriota bacterium]
MLRIGLALIALSFLIIDRQTIDNQALGMMVEYAMGTDAPWIDLDSNRDGRIDARARVGARYDEIWEDRDYDGYFEIYLKSDGGTVIELAIDTDGDGRRDLRLFEDDAATYWQTRFVAKSSVSNPKSASRADKSIG